jgi:hypothetical protein
MAEAEPVIRAVLPDANVPTSIRSTGLPVVHGSASDLGSILDTWLATHADGIACVIGDPTFRATSRVRSLTPELSKGLEFDLVVLIDPEAFGSGQRDRHPTIMRTATEVQRNAGQPHYRCQPKTLLDHAGANARSDTERPLRRSRASSLSASDSGSPMGAATRSQVRSDAALGRR